MPESTTLNLMDYANGTELWKYQWDLIHNPETILLGAYNEEEGAMTDDVFWINYFSRNITIHPDYTIGNDNLNYITPAGKPFVLPMSASVSFSGSFTNKSTNSTEQVAMPRGVLYAFADETGTYYANLTKKTGGQYYFNGYLKVVAGAAEAFSAIHKALKAKEAGLLVLCMDRSALLMGRHANHVETIRSLCVSVPDVGELEKVLKKLHDMAPEDCAKFLDDLATQNLLCCR